MVASLKLKPHEVVIDRHSKKTTFSEHGYKPLTGAQNAVQDVLSLDIHNFLSHL